MKFIHTADIHLDSPLAGLSAAKDAPFARLRDSTRAALRNLVDYALAEAVDFVVIAGDLYDGTWRDYSTGLFLTAQMARLGGAGIPAYVVLGNHDAESKLTRQLTLPANVHVFAADKAQTIRLDACDVALHGRSFPTPALGENIALAYPPPVPGRFNIGLLHTAAGGREAHANYAPCALADLLAKGYDYWALGHVHAREILSERPHVVFPGNLQGRNIRETGAKGFTVVRVEDGRVVAADHVAADAVRWFRCGVDLAEAADFDDVLDAVGRGACLGRRRCRRPPCRRPPGPRRADAGACRPCPKPRAARCRMSRGRTPRRGRGVDRAGLRRHPPSRRSRRCGGTPGRHRRPAPRHRRHERRR